MLPDSSSYSTDLRTLKIKEWTFAPRHWAGQAPITVLCPPQTQR